MSEPTFFGKIMDLIDREATDARPRPAPDVVRDLVGAWAKLIEAAPADHRDGLRAIISRLGLERIEAAHARMIGLSRQWLPP
jgi:hypothetical protein